MRARRFLTRREREQRARRTRRASLAAGLLLLLAYLAMTPGLRDRIANVAQSGIQTVSAFAGGTPGETEAVLPAMQLYALQVGVFENAESAERERARLGEAGLPCMLWQRDKARIVCGAAFDKGALDEGAAQGKEVCVIEEKLPEVRLRLGGEMRETQAAAQLFALPDTLLSRIAKTEEPLDMILQSTRETAASAADRHPECVLHTQLAQSLENWCTLIGDAQETYGGEKARSYAAVTMATLCRELRMTLLAQGTE